MSTDAAHCLGDALDVDLRTARTWRETTEVEPSLHALAVGAHTAVEADWQVVRDYLLGVLDAMGVDAVVADELTSLPGAEEVAALAALARQADSGDWDVVVVDCAPTAETLRLLALPEVLGWHLDRLLPAQRRLLTVLRPAASAAAGVPVPGPEVLLGAARLARAAWSACAPCSPSPPRERARWCSRPSGSSSPRAGGCSPRCRCTATPSTRWSSTGSCRPRPPATPTRGAPRGRAPRPTGLEQVRESFLGIPLLCAPYLAGEPIGADALDALAGATEADAGGRPAPALLDDVDVPRMTVEADGDDFVLTLPLPLGVGRHGRDGAARGRPAARGGRPAPGGDPAVGAAPVHRQQCCRGQR